MISQSQMGQFDHGLDQKEILSFGLVSHSEVWKDFVLKEAKLVYLKR